MCGIAGVYHFGIDRTVEEASVRAMCGALRHRGPDDEGVYITPRVGLGMRRLSVIDLATGHQPLCNEDRTLWIVFNGEIYNYRHLRQDLAPRHTFSTQSDTETIIHLYEEYGESCVEHLRGMFAFAIWDERKQQLFIARDRVGKKPLYYTQHDGAFVFASEIPALIRWRGQKPPIDTTALDQYLSFQYIPSPRTIYTGVSALPPAHTLTCGPDGAPLTRRYWDIDYRQKTSLSFADACARTRELLDEATRLRMIADVPLGAFLSGGADSTIVVGLMSTHAAEPVKTFSVGFDEDDFSELSYARLAAQRFHTDHHEIIVRPHFKELLPEIARRYGQPFADASALPSYMIAQETRTQVTVALNGDGGDEAFGGYRRYQAMRWASHAAAPFRMAGRPAARMLSRLIPGAGSARGNSRWAYAARFIDGLSETPAGRMARYASFFTDETKAFVYADAFRQAIAAPATAYLADLFNGAAADTDVDRAMWTDMHSYLPECLLVKMDIASMAHGLEARSPFLDHVLLEFAASLPHTWKLRGLSTKYILRTACKDLLPQAIAHRGKQGFGVPVSRWFRTDWKDFFRDVVLSKRALARGYFDPSGVRRLFDQHLSGHVDHGRALWALLMLELWHTEVYDG